MRSVFKKPQLGKTLYFGYGDDLLLENQRLDDFLLYIFTISFSNLPWLIICNVGELFYKFPSCSLDRLQIRKWNLNWKKKISIWRESVSRSRSKISPLCHFFTMKQINDQPGLSYEELLSMWRPRVWSQPHPLFIYRGSIFRVDYGWPLFDTSAGPFVNY